MLRRFRLRRARRSRCCLVSPAAAACQSSHRRNRAEAEIELAAMDRAGSPAGLLGRASLPERSHRDRGCAADPPLCSESRVAAAADDRRGRGTQRIGQWPALCPRPAAALAAAGSCDLGSRSGDRRRSASGGPRDGQRRRRRRRRRRRLSRGEPGALRRPGTPRGHRRELPLGTEPQARHFPRRNRSFPDGARCRGCPRRRRAAAR